VQAPTIVSDVSTAKRIHFLSLWLSETLILYFKC